MAARGDAQRYLPEAERQIPLSVKYADRWILEAISEEFRVTETASAMALAAVEAHPTGRAISYSRSKDFYRHGDHRHPLVRSYREVVDGAVDLEQLGHIDHFRQVPGGLGWQSAFAAKPHLVAAVHRLVYGGPRLRLVAPTKLTLLRDACGSLMNFNETREIQRQERTTAAVNEALCAADIQWSGEASSAFTIAGPLVRIFNETFRQGGRFYAQGSTWQNLRAGDRARIQIDGEPTVEIDFRAMHPTLLYNAVGKLPPQDCYAVAGWPRPLAKKGLLILINAPTERKARSAIANSDEMKAFGEEGPGAIASASRLINDLKHLHSPIAHLFHADAGLRLMRSDADLMEAIMKKVTLSMGIAVLPLHDAVIAQVSKADIVADEMMSAARQFGLVGLTVVAKTRSEETTEHAA